MYPRAILQLRHSRAAHALAAAPAWQRGRAAGVVMVDAYEMVFLERRPAHGAGVALGLQHLAEPLRGQAHELELVRPVPAGPGLRGDECLSTPTLRQLRPAVGQGCRCTAL
jgi:hypothetical protein